MVSAKKQKGEVTEIQIVAEKGGVVQLRNVFPGGIFRPVKATRFFEDGSIQMQLAAGEKVILSQ